MNESHDEEAGNKHKHEISPHKSMYKCRISQILQLRLKRKKIYRSSLSIRLCHVERNAWSGWV